MTAYSSTAIERLERENAALRAERDRLADALRQTRQRINGYGRPRRMWAQTIADIDAALSHTDTTTRKDIQ